MIIDEVIKKIKDKEKVYLGVYEINLGNALIKSHGFEGNTLWTKDNLGKKCVYNLETGVYYSYQD